MRKKILIGSILAVLLMLSMPVISNIQAQKLETKTDLCSCCNKLPDYPCEAWLRHANGLEGMANTFYDLADDMREGLPDGVGDLVGDKLDNIGDMFQDMADYYWDLYDKHCP